MYPHFLRETAAGISNPLSIIFRKSLESKYVLAEWKKGRITPLIKKGSKELASHYRPVIIASVVCECLENW